MEESNKQEVVEDNQAEEKKLEKEVDESTTISLEKPKSSKKRILLTVTGSRGDVQPMLVLAIKFLERGYDVRFASHEEYRSLAESVGVTDYVGLSGNPSEIMQSPAIKELFQSGSTFKAVQKLTEAGKPFIRKNMEEIGEACKDVDAILYNASTVFATIALAEKHKIPIFGSYTIPVYPTKEMAPAMMGMTSTGFGFLNSMMHSLVNYLAFNFALGDDIHWWRNKLNLKPIKSMKELLSLPIPLYHIYSPSLVPKPSDWASNLEVTGYVFPTPTVVSETENSNENSLKTPFNHNWKPSNELTEFLNRDTDRPPVYVGFGSMSMFDNKKMLSIVVPAIQKIKGRCILCSGWSEVDSEFFTEATKATPNDFLLIKFAPHDWLFPKCSIIVHHGGAGTTGAALAAGKPSVVCSVLGDQPFWGKKLTEMKLGFHIPMKDLTWQKLQNALVNVSNPQVAENAKVMGEKISNEDGANVHVDKIIERLESGNVYIPTI